MDIFLSFFLLRTLQTTDNLILDLFCLYKNMKKKYDTSLLPYY